jgi:hypothetical protein
MQPKDSKLHRGAQEKRGCISTSKLHKRVHPSIESFTKEKRMHLSRSKASDKMNLLKAVYKWVEAKEKQKG